MNTLQSTLDDVHVGPAAASKTGNTDAIRIMLREQKRECAELHGNPIFKELREEQKKGSGAGGHLEATREAAPVIDDLEAEGRTRLTDLIKRAAADRESQPAGVWASFGKPYACLGELVQLDSSAAALLPKLNRDELSSSHGPRRTSQQKRPGSQQAGMLTGGATSAAKHADKAVAAASGEKRSSSPENGNRGNTKEDMNEETAKLLKHKTVAKFSMSDRLEASFPAAAVKQAEARSKAARKGGNTFFNKGAAEADLRDAAASYGKHHANTPELPGHALVQQHQAATAALAAASKLATGGLPAGVTLKHAETVGDRKSVFITQRATAGVDAAGPGHHHSPASGYSTSRSNQGRSSSPVRGGSPHRLTIGAAAAVSGGAEGSKSSRSRRTTVTHDLPLQHRPTVSLHELAANVSNLNSIPGSQLVDYSALGSSAVSDDIQIEPEFEALTELTQQAPGETNPVTDWHNNFVKTRQAGYTALQETLWQRSQQRAAARSDPSSRAAFNKSLMEHLELTQGKLTPGWIPGTIVESPFASGNKSKAATAAAAATDGQATAGTRVIKQAEVELLENFYDALCCLVEKQRLSDPLSLTIVHQVKALLEGGMFLQPPLLQQVIHKTADFVKSCGLVRYNRFALPLLTFIRKCVGVSAADLQAMAAAAGISTVLYEPPPPPQQQQSRPQSPGKAAGMQVVVNLAVEGLSDPDKAGAAGTPRSPRRTGPSRSNSRALDRDLGSISPRRNSAIMAAERSPSMVRRNSRLESAASQRFRDVPVPPIPIDAAMAAAVNDIALAVHSAPQTQRAAAGIDGGPVKVRVPGVAGHVEVVQRHADVAAADMPKLGSASLSGKLDKLVGLAATAGQARSEQTTAEAVMDADDLPDLGEDESGHPLSRRVRNEEGNMSWREGRQPTVAAPAVDSSGEAGTDDL